MGNDDWWWWIYSWLVVDLPLWKIWVRRLGWRHSQYMEKQNMFKTTNQCWFVLPARHTKWIPSALLLLISFLRKMSENRIHHSTYSKNWWNDDWHCNFFGNKFQVSGHAYIRKSGRSNPTWLYKNTQQPTIDLPEFVEHFIGNLLSKWC